MPGGKKKAHKTPVNKNNAKPPAKAPGELVIPPTTPKKNTAPPALALPVTPGGTVLEYKQIQQDEVEALEAIFMEDYTRVEKAGAWNTSDHAFKLHLKSYSDEEYHCDLSVVLTASYPKTAPQLKLSTSSPLTQRYFTRLENVLKGLPKQFLGREMIYDIATGVQETLEDIAVNKMVDKAVPSLDVERARKALEEQKRAEEEEALKRRKIEQEELEKDKQLELEIEKELKRKREQAKDHHHKRRMSTILTDDLNTTDTEDSVVFDRAIKISTTDGPCIFRKVCGMVKIAQGPLMTVYSVRPAFPVHEHKNLPLVLKQLELPNSFSHSADGKREIQNLEQEVDSLRNFRHPNVIELYESKVTRENNVSSPIKSESCSVGGWRISILTEFANRGSLHDLLETVECVSASTARLWTVSLLEGLDYIHRNGAVHSGIHPGNILLSRSENGKHPVPKFGDISYTPTLYKLVGKNRQALTPENWLPPEFVRSDPSGWTTSRKSDIWNFGVVFLQMVFGLSVVKDYNSPQALMDSVQISGSLYDFLESIFKIEPKERPTPFELLPSEFLRSDDPIIVKPSPRAQSPELSRMSWSLPGSSSSRGRRGSAPQTMVPAVSRYATDFVELGQLGKGGYGRVVKARNKLDGQDYAIKIIRQKKASKMTSSLGEVMLLSRLTHSYLVRYFQAWVEEGGDTPVGSDVDSEDDDSETSATGSSLGTKTGTGKHTQTGGDDSDVDTDEMDHTGYETTAGGLDLISSGAGYSKIEFGYDSDVFESGSEEEDDEEDSESDGDSEGDDSDEEEEDDSTTDAKHPKSASNTKSDNKIRKINRKNKESRKQTLYIQMSLAERQTLRDSIRKGLEVEECWALFRKIVEGLAYLHKHGVIHRDLKPENIFINQAGDPQIGDFGLATNELIINNTLVKGSGEDTVEGNELTTNVGTTFYVAPELKLKAGHYNEKVDIYSLGIIFFEMCYPLGTGMERGHTLMKLREPEIIFPQAFWTEKRNTQGELIRSLLSHNPAARPGCRELLASRKLPFVMEDQVVTQALNIFADPETPYLSQVVQSLMKRKPKEYKDQTYESGRKDTSWHELLLKDYVKQRLTSIFRIHGAVSTTRPLLIPKGKFHDAGAVTLLDADGTIVQLPHDLTLPNARFLAKEPSPAPKTYTFGTVYRQTATGGQPATHDEVDFDIVSKNESELPLAEAETIKVLNDIVDGFPSMKGAEVCFQINHSSLLDAIMDFCRIKATQKDQVKEIISKLNAHQWRWPKIRDELAGPKHGILPTSLDDLHRFDWRDEPDKAFDRLKGIFEGSPVAEGVKPLFDHIRKVHSYLKLFGVKRKIYLNPLGTWNDKFYRGGIVFQCLHGNRQRALFAAGGRYDALIAGHSSKLRGPEGEKHAVGFNLPWEQLYTSMAKYQYTRRSTAKSAPSKPPAQTSGPWATRRCDVVVSAFDNSALKTQGISLLSDLWAAGIHAELAPEGILRENECRKNGVGWIVTIRQSHANNERNIRIKELSSRHDVDVKPSELITHLKCELAERDASTLEVERQLHQHAEEPSETMDVRIFAADRKGRKITRSTIIDGAQRAAEELSAGFLKAPVVAIDVRDDVLEDIKHTDLQDTEGWRRLTNKAPAPDRPYIASVQEGLEGMKSEGLKVCWVFNIRTGNACICYLA